MKIAVIGASGRLGTTLCEGLALENDIEIVSGLGSKDDVSNLSAQALDAVLDVSNAKAARDNLPVVAHLGLNVVVGTSGLSPEDQQQLHEVFQKASARCLIVPNFAISAILAIRFAELATPHFDNVEIIEMHHRTKRDSPSGMAIETVRRIDQARVHPWGASQDEDASDARGEEAAPGVQVHSVRLPGIVAHQDVIFGSLGQTLTLSYDTSDRKAFVSGATVALRALDSLPPGLTVGLDQVLGLD